MYGRISRRRTSRRHGGHYRNLAGKLGLVPRECRFPNARQELPVSTKYRCHRPCHLQMSLGSGGGGRARSSQSAIG